LQTERTSSFPPPHRKKGRAWVNYFQTCHAYPLCVIWDYTDFNLGWLQRQGFANSTMIMPILIQNRLKLPRSGPLVPLHNRSVDLAMFGVQSFRRWAFFDGVRTQKNNTLPDTWVVEHNPDVTHMVDTYLNTKICLVLHTFSANSGAEFHRLSETSLSGCLAVMERWDDASWVSDSFSRCGGILFCDMNNTQQTIEAALLQIKSGSLSTTQSVEWWRRGIDWPMFLLRVFQLSPLNATRSGRI
jgi:hypothetical protein